MENMKINNLAKRENVAVREVSTMAEPLAVVRSSRRRKWKSMARILCVDRRNVGKRGRGRPRKFPIMK